MKINGFTIKELFLENKSLKQTIFKNMTWLSVSEFVTRLFSFFLTVFIARILGAESYGLLTFAISLTAFFSILLGFCNDSIIIRELNQRKEAKSELGTVLGFRIILGIIVFFLIIGISFFVQEAARSLVVVFASVVLVDAVSTFFKAAFRAIQKIEYVALAEVGKSISLTGAGILVLVFYPNINLISYAYLLGNITAFLIGFLGIRRLFTFPSLSFNYGIIRKYFFLSWPLALGAVLNIVYIQIDSVMMGFWGMVREVGWYQAAYKIINFVTFFGVVKIVLFPAIAQAFKKSREYFQRIINRFFELVSFIALPVMAGGFLLSKEIILFLYDDGFYPSVLAFKILIFVSGLILFTLLADAVLISGGYQKIIFYLTGSTALLNVALNFILIPKYSLYGAAIATLISYAFLFLLSFIVLKRFRLLPNLKMIFAPLLSVVVMAVFLYSGLTQQLNVISQIGIAGSLYLTVFFGVFLLKGKLMRIKN